MRYLRTTLRQRYIEDDNRDAITNAQTMLSTLGQRHIEDNHDINRTHVTPEDDTGSSRGSEGVGAVQ